MRGSTSGTTDKLLNPLPLFILHIMQHGKVFIFARAIFKSADKMMDWLKKWSHGCMKFFPCKTDEFTQSDF